MNPIIIPAVVLSDLIAHYENEIKNDYKELIKTVHNFERYVYEGTEINLNTDIVESIKGYEDWLENRISELGIYIQSYPKVKHEDVVKRCAEGRRPFKNHDRGYKDTLIWESILEYLKLKGGEVILLSVDQDFGENAILHQDLLSDVKRNGIDVGSVQLFQEFSALIEYLLKKYNVSLELEEEERALWASVSKQLLNKTVPFKRIISEQKSQIEKIIFVNANRFVNMSDFNNILSLSKEIEVKNVEFNASYTGNGIWKLDGEALADIDLEVISIISDNLQTMKASEELRIGIQFTIYFDWKTKGTSDAIIRNVKKID